MHSARLTSVRWQQLPWLWWGIAAVAIILDLSTKYWAQNALNYAEPWVITPFFNFELRYNYGAAFSFLSDHSGWQRWFFAAIAGTVSAVLSVWLVKINGVKEKRLEALGLALILGGAVGNLYDRLTLGYVVDFIVVHYQEHDFPAFNIADSAICIGAGFLILDMFKNHKAENE